MNRVNRIIEILKKEEYGRADNTRDYLRIEPGYYPEQFYVSGIKNSFYISVLFQIDGKQFKVLNVLSGEGTFASFKVGEKLTTRTFVKWFRTLKKK